MVVYAASRIPWSAREDVHTAPRSVVWLSEWRPFERIPEPSVPPEAEPPVPAVRPEREPLEAEPPAQAEQTDPPALSVEDEGASTASPSDRRGAYLAPGIDWEIERQRAVARVLEELLRQETFSTGDSEEAPPNPREHLFDNPSRGSRSGRGSVLQPGRARSRFLNRVAELCNALTGGGIGIGFAGFALGSACTEPGPTADFFADIRPDALNSLPECAEPEDLPALAIERRDEIPTIKCRLVLKDEDER
jgi:hypothetical protein